MRAWLALAALSAALGASPGAAYAGEAARPVVVELYTSQSCSSCLPADAFLSRLAGRKDVLALSLPITYWDMLGWKDTLATEANTARQKAYASAMGRGGVYTPQMIVDGTDDIVGSREMQVDAAIKAHEAGDAAVPVALTLEPGEIHLTVGDGAKGRGDATIWLLRIRGAAAVKIGGGENSGRMVTYRNVVREVKAVGLWKGRPVTLDLPRSAMGGRQGNGSGDGFVALVQDGGYGRILGASWIAQ